MRNKTGLSWALLAATALLVAACSGTGPKPAPKQDAKGGVKGTFVLAQNNDVKVLNPILSSDVYSNYINNVLFDALMAADEGANLKPNLAKAWHVAGDNKTITFDLRDDVKWHDGEKFTAKDVIFTFNAVMHPQYTGPRRSDFNALAGVKAMDDQVSKLDQKAADYDAQVQTIWAEWVKNSGAIVAKGDYTVEFHLDQVFAPILNNLTLRLIPEHKLRGTEGKKLADAEVNQHPVGTGPMKFVEWKKGDHLTVQQNPDYHWGLFGHPFQYKTFMFKVVPDGNAAMAGLENGEVDYAEIDPDSWDKFSKLPNVQAIENLVWGYQFLGYNFHNPVLAEKPVRQALTMAINRDAIIKDLRKGHAQPIHTHGAPGRWDYNENVKKWPYDLAAAGKLLEDAGWKLNPATGIREKDGKKLTFTFNYSSGNKLLESIATLAQQSWKQIGVDPKLEAMKFEAILDKAKQDKIEAFTLGWSLGIEPDSYSIFHSQGGFAYMIHYSNPQVDQLLEQGRKVMEIPARKEIYAKVQEILADDQPYTWINYNKELRGFTKRIHGVKPSAAVGWFWNMAEWTVDGD